MRTQSSAALDIPVVHLPASLRERAEAASAHDGMTLDEFIAAAVLEKIEHQAHIEWVRGRQPVTEEGLAEALRILNRAGSIPPEPGDELPEGWPR